MVGVEIKIGKHKKVAFEELLTLQVTTEHCGLTSKYFTIKPEFGTGNLTTFSFQGLKVRQLEITLNRNIEFKGSQDLDALVFSALLSGEKKIQIPNSNIEIVQENSESYISYFNSVEGSITYPKNKSIKEVVIKMSSEFIKKHQLNSLFPIHDRYSVTKFKHNFTYQMDQKLLNIVSELIIDDNQGILKRLFLESKALEILSSQIANKNKKTTKNPTAIKNIYSAKDIITKNLDTQLSISELSKKVFLNEFMLKKEFKRVFGVTIFEYALNERMKEAKRLLSYTSKPICEISQLVGYKNPTHFTAAFKKKERVTPRNYRKQ